MPLPLWAYPFRWPWYLSSSQLHKSNSFSDVCIDLVPQNICWVSYWSVAELQKMLSAEIWWTLDTMPGIHLNCNQFLPPPSSVVLDNHFPCSRFWFRITDYCWVSADNSKGFPTGFIVHQFNVSPSTDVWPSFAGQRYQVLEHIWHVEINQTLMPLVVSPIDVCLICWQMMPHWNWLNHINLICNFHNHKEKLSHCCFVDVDLSSCSHWICFPSISEALAR